jgi:hypothetical protein
VDPSRERTTRIWIQIKQLIVIDWDPGSILTCGGRLSEIVSAAEDKEQRPSRQVSLGRIPKQIVIVTSETEHLAEGWAGCRSTERDRPERIPISLLKLLFSNLF